MTPHRQNLRAYVAVLLVLLLACALAGCGGGAKNNADGTAAAPVEPGKGEPGSTAPAYELADVSGKTVSSAEFAGKVVILDFWATWCPPCREEIPHFVKLQEKYRAQGLEIVGLSLDAGGAADVGPFAEKYGVNYTMLIANDDLAKAYGGIVALPTTFVIDRQGKIVKRFVGYTAPEVFEATIAPLLATTS